MGCAEALYTILQNRLRWNLTTGGQQKVMDVGMVDVLHLGCSFTCLEMSIELYWSVANQIGEDYRDVYQ